MIDLADRIGKRVGRSTDAAAALGSIHARLAELLTNRITAARAAKFDQIGVRSIQQGTVTLNGVTSNTAAITSVNTGKAMLIHNGEVMGGPDNNWSGFPTKITLTNATTVTASKGSSYGGGTVTVGFVVVEFY